MLRIAVIIFALFAAPLSGIEVVAPPIRSATSLYADPMAHSPTDMDGPHENTHGANSRIRNYWMQKHGGRWNAMYVLRNRAFVIQEPPTRLSVVAGAIRPEWRGSSFQLYFVSQAAAWDDSPLYVLDEWSAYLNGLECDMSTTTPHNDIPFQYKVCLEFQNYAYVLSKVVHERCPGYEYRQLDDAIIYQAKRLKELVKKLALPQKHDLR